MVLWAEAVELAPEAVVQERISSAWNRYAGERGLPRDVALSVQYLGAPFAAGRGDSGHAWGVAVRDFVLTAEVPGAPVEVAGQVISGRTAWANPAPLVSAQLGQEEAFRYRPETFIAYVNRQKGLEQLAAAREAALTPMAQPWLQQSTFAAGLGVQEPFPGQLPGQYPPPMGVPFPGQYPAPFGAPFPGQYLGQVPGQVPFGGPVIGQNGLRPFGQPFGQQMPGAAFVPWL